MFLVKSQDKYVMKRMLNTKVLIAAERSSICFGEQT